MTKICANCNKKSQSASHYKKVHSQYNPTKYYHQKPNLQFIKTKNGKRVLVCSKCRKKMLKEMAS